MHATHPQRVWRLAILLVCYYELLLVRGGLSSSGRAGGHATVVLTCFGTRWSRSTWPPSTPTTRTRRASRRCALLAAQHA